MRLYGKRQLERLWEGDPRGIRGGTDSERGCRRERRRWGSRKGWGGRERRRKVKFLTRDTRRLQCSRPIGPFRRILPFMPGRLHTTPDDRRAYVLRYHNAQGPLAIDFRDAGALTRLLCLIYKDANKQSWFVALDSAKEADARDPHFVANLSRLGQVMQGRPPRGDIDHR